MAAIFAATFSVSEGQGEEESKIGGKEEEEKEEPDGEDALTGEDIPAGQSYVFPLPPDGCPEDFMVSLRTAVAMSIQDHEAPIRNPFTGVDLSAEVEVDLEAKCAAAGVDGPSHHRRFLEERADFDEQLPNLRAMLKIHLCLQHFITASKTFSEVCDQSIASLPATKGLSALVESFLPVALVVMGHRVALLDYESAEEGLIAVRQQLNPAADLAARAPQHNADAETGTVKVSDIVAAACNKALVTLRTKMYPDASKRPALYKRHHTDLAAINLSVAELLDTVLVEMPQRLVL